jgi:hypothetical protein
MSAAARLDPRFGTPRYLSVRQPYAHAIVEGIKLVENRTWETAYRGLVIIHAGKSRKYMPYRDERLPAVYYREACPLTFGAFIGVAILEACVDVSRLRAKAVRRGVVSQDVVDKLAASPFLEGPISILFSSVVAFRHPVPFVANTGLRRVDPGLLHAEDVGRINAKLLDSVRK